jgi:hypothetical protein
MLHLSRIYETRRSAGLIFGDLAVNVVAECTLSSLAELL